VIDPWIAETQAQKVAARTEIRSATRQCRMTRDEIAAIVAALGDLVRVIHDADPADKADLYAQLGLTLTYRPQKRLVEASVTPSLHMCKGFVSEGDLNPHGGEISRFGIFTGSARCACRIRAIPPRRPEHRHHGGQMRPADIPGTRAYCTDATNLNTSVQNLGNADVATNGLSSLQTALTSVKTSASAFVTDAKSAYPSQTAALSTSLSGLQTAITPAKGQPPVTAATTVVPAVTQVKSSASGLQSAASGKCQ
jgi:hypothetical protein